MGVFPRAAVSLCFSWIITTSDLLFPYSEELGTFTLLVGEMLWADVICSFFPIFLPFVIGFTCAATILVPPGTGVDGSFRWMNFWLSFENLLNLCLKGTFYDLDPNLYNLLPALEGDVCALPKSKTTASAHDAAAMSPPPLCSVCLRLACLARRVTRPCC